MHAPISASRWPGSWRAVAALVPLLFLTVGCEDPPVDPPVDPPASVQDAAQPPEPAPATLRVIGEVGVEVQEGEDWRAVEPGQEIPERIDFRTGEKRARIGFGEGEEIVVEPSTELKVTSVDGQDVSLDLQRGRIGANLTGARRLKIRSTRTGAVAEATKGRFSVFDSGRGLVGVASETADVKLTTRGGQALLAPGEQATFTGETAPQVAKIPEEVYLRVAWPEGVKKVRTRKIVLAGNALPGSVVKVNGKEVLVDAEGSFSQPVALRQGQNDLKVVTTDLLGRTRAEDRTVQARWTRPEVDAGEEVWE